jgi:hypothetical protein
MAAAALAGCIAAHHAIGHHAVPHVEMDPAAGIGADVARQSATGK